MKKINAVLVLGCNGCSKNNFIFCSKTTNIVIKLSELDDEQYEKIITFLDKTCGLFDSKISDHNKCFNIVNMLYKTYKLINLADATMYQEYFAMHKMCGTYLMLIMTEDFCV